jgi:hypothetical protein
LKTHTGLEDICNCIFRLFGIMLDVMDDGHGATVGSDIAGQQMKLASVSNCSLRKLVFLSG